MKNTKILEMINDGRIDELKKNLQDEIYAEELKSKPGAKKRYAAMKKYFKYTNHSREALQKPCVIEFEGREYTSFTNSYSLVLTTESAGEMELFPDPERYPQVSRLIRRDGDERKVNFSKIFAEAKSKGYKLNKSEVDSFKYRYLLEYDNAYFKMGLLEATYAIIDDGEDATVYHDDASKYKPITIETSLGICIVLPMKIDSVSVHDHIIIKRSKRWKQNLKK